MQDVAVIEDAAAAEVSLDPIRARMLAELAEPHTATTLAARLGLARQKVNYHVKTLEQHGLVELVEERRKGNMTERVVRASAAAYVISPRGSFGRRGRSSTGRRGPTSRSPRSGSMPKCGSRSRPIAPRSWVSSPTRSPELSGNITPKLVGRTALSSRCTRASPKTPTRQQRSSSHDASIRGTRRDHRRRHAGPGVGGDRVGAGSRLVAHGAHRNR